jgi:hypothetical protein
MSSDESNKYSEDKKNNSEIVSFDLELGLKESEDVE